MLDALLALDTAVTLAPTRADVLAAHARLLRAAGKRNEARLEFQKVLNLDSASLEAQAGLISLRPEPKHELRFGQDTDLFNFASANNDEWTSLASQWTPHWATSLAGSFYQRGGVDAGKFVASVTRRQPKWGAITVGGAIGHDSAIIPKRRAMSHRCFGPGGQLAGRFTTSGTIQRSRIPTIGPVNRETTLSRRRSRPPGRS